MIKKFVLWESKSSIILDDVARDTAPNVERSIVLEGQQAIEATRLPLLTQLAIKRQLIVTETGGEIVLDSEQGFPIFTISTEITIADMELSVRSTNCLREACIRTLDELLNWTADELMGLPHFGVKSLNEIKNFLDQIGCKLSPFTSIRTVVLAPSLPQSRTVALACLLKLEEFSADQLANESLRQCGWNEIADLASHSLSEVSLVGNLSAPQTENLGQALREAGIELPLSIPDWLQKNRIPIRSAFRNEIDAYVKSIHEETERASSTSSAESLYDELQELIPHKYNVQKRRIIALLFGLDGDEPMTLEAVAQAITPPVTRERIRQIALPVTNALSNQQLPRPWLKKTIGILEDLAPCNIREAETFLFEENVTGKPMTVGAILALAKRANIETGLLVTGDSLQTTSTSSYLTEVTRKAAKLSSHWGVADWEEVSQGLVSKHLALIDRAIPEAVYLDEARRYLVFPQRENSLANRLARILAVAPSLTLASAYRGAFRDARMEQTRLPEALFRGFCELWSWCKVEGDSIRAVKPLPPSEASGDDLLVLLLQEAGRPLRRREIQLISQQHGLSETTVTHALTYSNVIEAYEGYFSVVGDPKLYEVQSESTPVFRDFEIVEKNNETEGEPAQNSVLPSCNDTRAFVEQVVLGVRRKTTELEIASQWSVAELNLTRTDRENLLLWGRSAAWDFRSDTGSYRLPSGELVRKRTALGLTFVLFASVVDQEFANSSSIWPEIEEALGAEQRENFMFRTGIPKLALRDGMEDACRQFGLRHGFEDSGQQVIWRTIGLQFGLRRSHLPQLHQMLDEPYANQPVAIQLLLNSEGPKASVGFKSAWNLLRAIRSRTIPHERALTEIGQNSWLRSFEGSVILAACQTSTTTSRRLGFVDAEIKQGAYAYFGAPRIVLDSHEVYLDFDLTPDAPAWVDVPTLTFLCEVPFRKERLHVQGAQWSMAEDTLRLPITRLNELSFQFQILRGKETVVDETAGIRFDPLAPFLLFIAAGHLLDPGDQVPNGNELYILAGDAVQLTGLAKSSPFRVVLNGRARLTIVSSSDIASLRITRADGVLLWCNPSGVIEEATKKSVGIGIGPSRWGERARLALPPIPFTPTWLKLNSGEILSIREESGELTVESSPGLSRAQGARIYGRGDARVVSLAVNLIHRGLTYGAAIERRGEWVPLSGSETLDGALLGTNRLLARVQDTSAQQEICWAEGCRALSGLKAYGGTLLNVYGIGEPLNISSGVYNRPETLLNVANAVTDDGYLRGLNEQEPGVWVAALPFDTALEPQHALWLWSDSNASPTEIAHASISQDGFNIRWSAPKGSVVFGWAFSFAGQRLGSTRIKERQKLFAVHLQKHWPRTVEWIRWWHVPVFHEDFRSIAKLSAGRFPMETVIGWNIGEANDARLVFDELREDAWATASRQLLWDWRPDSSQSLILAKTFEIWTGNVERDSADRTDIPGMGRLARVSPLLLARIIVKALPALYPFSSQELAALVALALKTINENSLQASFRIRDLCERYAQGETRLDGEFIYRSILNAASAEFQDKKIERQNLQAAFHQSGLREIVTISLLREILFEWRKGAALA